MKYLIPMIAVSCFLIGCGVASHPLYYGDSKPPAISATIGKVEAIQQRSKGLVKSPSIIAPDRAAIVSMSRTVKGNGVGKRIALVYESGRTNEPQVGSSYLFTWDDRGRCIAYYSVQGDNYIKDGKEWAINDWTDR
jgi:hypothetical protein